MTMFRESAFPWTSECITNPTFNGYGCSSGNSWSVRSILCIKSGVIAFCIGALSSIFMHRNLWAPPSGTYRGFGRRQPRESKILAAFQFCQIDDLAGVIRKMFIDMGDGD